MLGEIESYFYDEFYSEITFSFYAFQKVHILYQITVRMYSTQSNSPQL